MEESKQFVELDIIEQDLKDVVDQIREWSSKGLIKGGGISILIENNITGNIARNLTLQQFLRSIQTGPIPMYFSDYYFTIDFGPEVEHFSEYTVFSTISDYYRRMSSKPYFQEISDDIYVSSEDEDDSKFEI